MGSCLFKQILGGRAGEFVNCWSFCRTGGEKFYLRSSKREEVVLGGIKV